MKTLLFLVMFAAQSYSSAAELDTQCTVTVLPSVCGSGTVELELSGKNFNLNYGDIGCWFSNNIFNGEIKEKARTGYSIVYDLRSLTKSHTFGKPYDFTNKIGTIEVSNESQIVKARLDQSMIDGSRGSEYHLSCESL